MHTRHTLSQSSAKRGVDVVSFLDESHNWISSSEGSQPGAETESSHVAQERSMVIDKDISSYREKIYNKTLGGM